MKNTKRMEHPARAGQSRSDRFRRPAAVTLLAISLLGCFDGAAGPDALTWQEFRASSTRRLDGKEIYAVESGLMSLEELRAHYLEHYASVEERELPLVPCECDLKECKPMCAGGPATQHGEAHTR